MGIKKISNQEVEEAMRKKKEETKMSEAPKTPQKQVAPAPTSTLTPIQTPVSPTTLQPEKAQKVKKKKKNRRQKYPPVDFNELENLL